MSENTETAIVAGGCFWPAQELLRHRDGVIATRVGYTGRGERPPDRGQPSRSRRGGRGFFDPGRTSYRNILEFSSRSTRPASAKRLSATIAAPRSSAPATSSARSPRTRSPAPRASGAPGSRPRSAKQVPSERPRPRIRTTSAVDRGVDDDVVHAGTFGVRWCKGICGQAAARAVRGRRRRLGSWRAGGW